MLTKARSVFVRASGAKAIRGNDQGQSQVVRAQGAQGSLRLRKQWDSPDTQMKVRQT